MGSGRRTGSEDSVTMAKGRAKPRRRLDGALKARVAIAAIKGDKTTAEICSQHGVHSTQVSKWKKQALSELPKVFGLKSRDESSAEELVERLYQQIGMLTMELDWLKKRL